MTQKQKELKSQILISLEDDIGNPDKEDAHYNGDIALCDLLTALGHKDVVDLWQKIDKWYS